MAESRKELIRKAIIYNIKQIVKNATNSVGYTYKYTISENSIGDPPKTRSQFVETPGVNIYIGEETGNNATTPLITGNDPILDLHFPVLFECFMDEAESPQDAKDDLVADFQARFGDNYAIPDSDGNGTCHYIVYTSSKGWGMENNEPKLGVWIEFDVSYRIKINNPTQLR